MIILAVTSLYIPIVDYLVIHPRMSRSSYVLKGASRHRARGAFDKCDFTALQRSRGPRQRSVTGVGQPLGESTVDR